MKKSVVKPLFGVGATAVMIVLMLTVFVQEWFVNIWGQWYVVFAELLFGIMAIVFALLTKVKVKEILPVSKFGAKVGIGSVIFFIGTAIFGSGINLISVSFFPQFVERNAGILDMVNGVPLWLSLLGVALCAGIGEEILFRGYVLKTAEDLPQWARIVLVGVLFAVMHWDLPAILPTAIMGMTFTYIVIRTRNIILPILLHALNNSTIVLINKVSGITGEQVTEGVASQDTAMMWAAGLVVLGLGGLVAFGGYLLCREKKAPVKQGALRKVLFFSPLIVFPVVFICGIVSMIPQVATSYQVQVSAEESEGILGEDEFLVPADYGYLLDVDFESAGAKLTLTVYDTDGSVAYNCTAADYLLVGGEQVPLHGGGNARVEYAIEPGSGQSGKYRLAAKIRMF